MIFVIAHYTKSNLTNPLPNLKDKVMNKVISLTDAPTNDINNTFVTPPLATERKTKLI